MSSCPAHAAEWSGVSPSLFCPPSHAFTAHNGSVPACTAPLASCTHLLVQGNVAFQQELGAVHEAASGRVHAPDLARRRLVSPARHASGDGGRTHRAAQCSGVLPALSTSFTVIPESTSSSMNGRFPRLAASCSGCSSVSEFSATA